MAAPITWQSVRADTDSAAAVRSLELSRQSVGGAFDAFQNIIAQREAVDRGNMQAGQESGKQAFLDKLAGARSPEELAELQRTGALDTSNLGTQARAALRGASEARLTGLRQGVTAENTFNDTLTARAEAPVAAGIRAKIQAGDFTGAQTDLDASGLRDRSILQAEIHNVGRTRIGEQRADFKVPYEQAGIVRADTTGKMNLSEAERVEAEKVEGRRVDALTNEFANNYQASAANIKSAVEGEAANLGLPTNLASLTTAQRATLDASLTAKGLPLTEDAISGDSRARDMLMAHLRENNVKATDAATRVAPILPQLLSTAPQAVMGNDAANVAAATAAATVGFDRDDATNSYAPGSADARRSYEELATKLPDIVKQMPAGVWFGDNQKDIPDLQRVLGEISTVGIKIKGEKGAKDQYVVPSVQDVMRFVRSEEGGFFDASRSKDVKSALEKWANSSEGQSMIKRGQESAAFRDAQRIKTLQREYLTGTPPPKK